MREKVKDDFRDVARFYEKVIHARHDNPWIESIKSRNVGNLMDLGGGTGRVLETFYPEIPLLFLADFSLPMLKAAQQKRKFNETCCLVEFLPYKDESFDAIIMVDAFHHLVHQQLVVAESLRVLNPGGILIIEEPDIAKFTIKLIALGEKLLGMRSRFYRIEEIENMLNGFHVKVERYKYSNNFYLMIQKL